MEPSALDRAKERVGAVLREKWRLDKLLGVGGSAAVYAATHVNNGKRAAVKMLHSELCAQKDIVKRFLKEGYFSNKIAHPGAVSVLDDDRAEDGSIYLVMELLEGHSLERYVRDKERLTASQVIHVVDEVLDLLVKAHALGILHRDIKPANIYLTNAGQVKVLDFGIARLTEPVGEARLTQTGTGIGTPSYMPPEQARGRWKLVDARSDLFAVGAMAFALLLGHRPRRAETANEELLLAMTEPLPRVRALLPDVDAGLAEVVDRACAFELTDRWPDARAMQRAARMVGRKASDVVDTEPGLSDAAPKRDTVPADLPGPRPPTTNVQKYRVPELPRSHPQLPGSASASDAALARSEPIAPGRDVPPPPPARDVPPPPPRSRLPAMEAAVDLRLVDLTPATPPPSIEPSQVLARRPFAASTALLAVAYEPQVGFLLLGPHVPKQEPARYRAWVMGSQSVLWETFHDQPWVAQVKDVRAIGPYLFVALRSTLLCVDLITGQTRWTFVLPGKVEVRAGGDERGVVVLDFIQQGSVIVQAGSTLVSIDPMSGAEQWRRSFPGKLETHAVEGTPTYAIRYTSGERGALELLAPGSPAAVASFGTQWFTDDASVVEARVVGQRVVARVESWGLLRANGMLVIDVPSRRQVAFDREKDFDPLFPPQSGPHGMYAIADGALVNPANRRAPPSLSGHRYVAFRVTGTSVVVVLEELGSSQLRLLVLDAASLQLVHDLGPLQPPGRFSLHMPQSLTRYCLMSGEYVVFPASVGGHAEIRCVHAGTGQVFWSRPRQESSAIDDAHMLAGHVILRAADSIEILDPTSGMLVARYGS